MDLWGDSLLELHTGIWSVSCKANYPHHDLFHPELQIDKYVQNSVAQRLPHLQNSRLHQALSISHWQLTWVPYLVCATESHRNDLFHFKQNFLFPKTFVGFWFCYSVGKSLCQNKPDYSYPFVVVVVFVWFLLSETESLYYVALVVLAVTMWTSGSQRCTRCVAPCSAGFLPFLA